MTGSIKEAGAEIDRPSWRFWRQIKDPPRLALLSDQLRLGLSYHHSLPYLIEKLLELGVHYYETAEHLPPKANALASFTIGVVGPPPACPPWIKQVGRYSSEILLPLNPPGTTDHYRLIVIDLPLSKEPLSVYQSSPFLKSPTTKLSELTLVETSAHGDQSLGFRRTPLYANPLTVMQALTNVDLNCHSRKLTVEKALLGVVDPNYYEKVIKIYPSTNQTPNFLLATRLSIK